MSTQTMMCSVNYLTLWGRWLTDYWMVILFYINTVLVLWTVVTHQISNLWVNCRWFKMLLTRYRNILFCRVWKYCPVNILCLQIWFSWTLNKTEFCFFKSRFYNNYFLTHIFTTNFCLLSSPGPRLCELFPSLGSIDVRCWQFFNTLLLCHNLSNWNQLSYECSLGYPA